MAGTQQSGQGGNPGFDSTGKSLGGISRAPGDRSAKPGDRVDEVLNDEDESSAEASKIGGDVAPSSDAGADIKKGVNKEDDAKNPQGKDAQDNAARKRAKSEINDPPDYTGVVG